MARLTERVEGQDLGHACDGASGEVRDERQRCEVVRAAVSRARPGPLESALRSRFRSGTAMFSSFLGQRERLGLQRSTQRSTAVVVERKEGKRRNYALIAPPGLERC